MTTYKTYIRKSLENYFLNTYTRNKFMGAKHL